MTLLQRKIGRLHFVGIGGIGMSGIAEILIRQGFSVSGSDLNLSEVTLHLETLGARIFQGHEASHTDGAQVVVYSSAVRMDNPECVRARELGIPLIRRAEMLAELMRLQTGIAVAGTHGKTTTTSLVGSVLTRAGFDPTVIVGGMVRDLDTNARLGAGEWMVVEADEYDRSFLKLTPSIAVLTTVEAEHLDTYGSLENLRDAFVSFADSVPFYGRVIWCVDDAELRGLRSRIERPLRGYGFSEDAEVRGVEPELGRSSRCGVVIEGKRAGTVELPLAGQHNLCNALAAVAVGLELNVPFDTIRAALSQFRGVRRRFDLRGEAGGVLVFDDYAHHPTEVAVTLCAARAAYPGRPIIALFQPHLFSRTQRFFAEFAEALALADRVIVTDVYPAREEPISGVTGRLIADRMNGKKRGVARYVPRLQDIAAQVRAMLQGNELVITLGAGNIYRASTELLGLLQDRAGSS